MRTVMRSETAFSLRRSAKPSLEGAGRHSPRPFEGAWRRHLRVKGRAVALAALSLTSLTSAALPAHAAEETSTLLPEYWEFFGEAELELTGFAEPPRFPGQKHHNASASLKPTLLAEWLDGNLTFKLTPFGRIDGADDRRTHFDLREAKLDYRTGDWEFTAGLDFVFWGKTEAVHLVDIVNSADGVEDLDLEDKLGQPMLRAAYHTDWGTFSLFYLPYFREPTFAGADGRLRGALPVDGEDPVYRMDGDEWAPSFAARWAHVIGDVDFGVSAFHGTSRDAAFQPAGFVTPGVPTKLRPVYDTVTQVGFDGQYTSGPMLWKLEAIGRFGQLDRTGTASDYIAITGGVEYTLFGVADTDADLGLILEGAWDSRGGDALTLFEEDVIYGLRLGLNDAEDTSVLLIGATDVVSGSTTLRLEAERRIADHWKLAVEGQAFLNTQRSDLEFDLRSDSFLRVKLSYFW